MQPTFAERVSHRLAALPGQWAPPEEIVLITASVVVGVGTGFGAVLFVWMMNRLGDLASLVQQNLGGLPGLLSGMALAGLVVGFVVERWAMEAKGHGVPEVMEAVALRGGRIRARVAAIKVIASSITIGMGGSAGREGPIVQVGSALGSTVGQRLHFSSERIRTLVACGAAAGIAATFNAPIAGAIFALEIILGRFTVRYFGTVVISSVSASIISRIFLSSRPAFDVPAYPLSHLAELPIYIVLAVLSALVAVAFIQLLYKSEGLFDGWHIPMAFKASLGMLLTGLVASLLPGREVLGPGLHFIGETIAGGFNLSLQMMAAFLLLKLVATSFTLGSGNSGGVFAPGLFMGATLGGIVGTLGHSLWPNIVLDPGAYAIVGMAAVFAGAARAPITAILIVFEMSGDYKLILPLMLATVLSTLVSEFLLAESIYTLKLKLRGIRLQSGRDEDVLSGVDVGEVMTSNIDTVSCHITLSELSDIFIRSRHHGLPVIDDANQLWGIVTVTDVDKAIARNMSRRATVTEFGTPFARLLVTYPDEPIGEALRRMSPRGLGRVPVVDRAQPRRLLGLLRREDIIQAYNMAVSRRAELQHRTKRAQLRNLDGTEFIDCKLESGDGAVGKAISELVTVMPDDCVVVSVRRNERVLIPHGETRLQAGDAVTAFVRSRDREQFLNSLRQANGPLASEDDPALAHH